MRTQCFKCHYCNEKIEGEHQFTLAFQLGFIWNAKKFDQPAWHFDFCKDCEKTFIKKYLEGQTERKAYIEAEKLKTWFKRFNIDKTFVEKRRLRIEVPYSRRHGDQINLFNEERNLEQWQNQRRPLVSSKIPALVAVRKRLEKANAPNATHTSRQTAAYFLN